MVVDHFTPPPLFFVLFSFVFVSYFTLLSILFPNGLFIKGGKVYNCTHENGPSLSKGKSLEREKGQGFDLVCLAATAATTGSCTRLPKLDLLIILPAWFGIWPARVTGVGGGWWYAAIAVGR